MWRGKKNFHSKINFEAKTYFWGDVRLSIFCPMRYRSKGWTKFDI